MNQLTDDQLLAIAKNPEDGARFIKEDKTKIGILCLVWENNLENSRVRYYAGNNKCFCNGNKSGNSTPWLNIVPIQAMEGFKLPE